MLSSSKAGLLTAAVLAAASSAELPTMPQYVFRGYGKFANMGWSRSVKCYPQMVVSSADQIAEWNRNVRTRQVVRQNVRRLGRFL